MTSFSPFIRKTSPDMRKVLSDSLGLSMSEDVNWADPSLKFASAMIAAVDAQSAGPILERIASMADEVGDLALEAAWNGQGDQPNLAGVQDRAIWTYVNHPESFRSAEEVRFIDSRRRTRRWEGFVVESNLDVVQTAEGKEAFAAALRGTVSDGLVQVDIFERNRRGFDGTDYRVVQITVYAEQKPEVNLEFRDAKIASVPRRPVLAAALTYEPLSGAVEVAANTQSVRAALVCGSLKNLLSTEAPIEAVKLRRFGLQHLKRRHEFATDPGDLIEGVVLRSLRLMPYGGDDQRLTIEVGRKSKRTIWDLAEAQFGSTSPLRSGWLVTSAVLSVSFRPSGTGKRGKTISMQITEPNGCDLKDRTELEQLIGNKYLQRWGILSDDVDLIED